VTHSTKSNAAGSARVLWLVLVTMSLASPKLLAQAGAFPALSMNSTDNSLFRLVETSDVGFGRMQVLSEPQRPQGVLKLADDQRYLLWVELKRGRLHVMERQDHGGLNTIKIIPISIGKNGYGKELEGDKLTPIGVYRLTSFIEDQGLDDFYGNGAFPLNYPNAHDRLQKRTGHGIWLHGLPKNIDQRPLMDSDGCVVVDNYSFDRLGDYIQTGATYIVMSEDDIKWESADTFPHQETSLSAAFEQWRSDWAAINNDAYLSHYGENFSDLTSDIQAWSTYKTRVNRGKTRISVETSDLSLIADPRDPQLVTARFYQSYRSNNHDWDGWKEQLWQQTDDGWKIIYEGNG
jgi:murein L,D-transpeptidase YafK